ncbi:hypothetical protein EDD27_3715 [Nonomuraea polychroma]|uniref:Uncharacterized protein n=1 Tax=Nonomuraea polychroma TaxID=46176 RepID=A0A438M5U5_9ACTN|nr:hypothetical protein EDD27_3715 [Nonomuraea polychroma]
MGGPFRTRPHGIAAKSLAARCTRRWLKPLARAKVGEHRDRPGFSGRAPRVRRCRLGPRWAPEGQPHRAVTCASVLREEITVPVTATDKRFIFVDSVFERSLALLHAIRLNG